MIGTVAEGELDKSPDAFRTISEVSEDLDLPQHVLRFWETRFGQIKPLKRGGGRRYYRPDDVELLKGIRHLLYGEGYTIKGVQRILKEEGLRFVQTVWKEQASISAPVLTSDAPDLTSKLPRGEFQETDTTDNSSLRIRELPTRAHVEREPASALPAGVIPTATTSISSGEPVRALQSALFELGECRRLIAAALSEHGES